ncbi:MAG: hypothetical protein ABIQ33_10890 [Caldimonas sp.]
MRERDYFEVRLRRFDLWHAAVGTVAAIAIATVVAWAAAMLDSQVDSGRAWVVVLAGVLGAGTIAVAVSLVRRKGGLLSCRDGIWTFSPDAGTTSSGTLRVSLDLGAFLLIRLGGRRRRGLWLPVQRSGLASEWHALRCAVYAAPPAAGDLPAADPRSSE